MLPVFLQIRADPDQAQDMQFQFQNVTFLLNTIDWLTGETDFIDVRKHEPTFASLKMIDSVKEVASEDVRTQTQKFKDDLDKLLVEIDEKRDMDLKSIRDELEDLQKKSADGKIDRAVLQAKETEFQIKNKQMQRLKAVKERKYERDRERNVAKIQRLADQKVETIQNKVKGYAVALPCIPPLIVGIIVFASRRLRERENITKARLK